MELNQLQLKQLVLQQVDGVERMVWNAGKVGYKCVAPENIFIFLTSIQIKNRFFDFE